ncbi:hypothetical protein N9U43_01455, partial [Cytophagia bacterium]|nr:hypothetical protein [Cytophagia bacterium]
MKKLLLILFMFLSVNTTYSQAPQGFNYQAIVRDANGNIRSNQGVQFIFEIRNAAGDAVYTEAHTTITNKYGLADDIIIGQGSTADNFSNINWGTGTYFVNVKVDGVDMGTTQLLSVPYALYALSAGSGSGGEDGEDGVGIESTVDNKDGSFTLNYTDGTSFTTVDLRGATGADGKSAYEVWLDLGNTGTAADFLLTLTGPQGEKGEKGEKGDDAVITGGASSVVSDDLDTSRVLVSNIAGKIAVSGISSTELNSLDNVKSNVQAQIDGKQALNDNLTRVSAMNPTDGSIIVGDGTKFVTEDGATARTSLGLGTLSTQDANAVLINGGSITGIADISIFDGGTGASTAKQARLNLNVDSAGTDNSTDVSLTKVPSNYLTLSGQEITAGIVPVELGGTGGASIVAARENLGLGTMAVQDNYNVSITGGEVKGITDLAVADGGTGASTAPAARTNLGLGTISTQNSNNVSISGGKITGAELSGLSTDIAIADGGTGSSTASGARTNLGLAIGSDVQAYDEELDDIASLDPTLNNFIVGDGTAFVKKNASESRDALNLGSIATQNVNNIKITGGKITGVTDIAIADGGTGASSAESARSNLGLAIGSDVQAYDAELKAIAGLTSMANKGIQFTGAGSAATFDLTNAAKTLLDDADVAAMRATLGVDAAGTDNSTDVTLANTNYLTISDQEITGGTVPLTSGGTGATTAAAARITLGVDAAGTDNSTAVTLSNTNYLTISGQEITGGTVPLTSGGTGATTAAAALSNLGLTATADEINILDGVTSTAAELNILDGVTATAIELNLIDGVTATTDEINYIDGVTSNIQTQLDAKQQTITGSATTIDTETLASSRAMVTNADGKIDISDVTVTELDYLAGVTSNIQTQLDAKNSTISGAATTIATSDLTASRALTSNGSGKVAVSDVTSTELSVLDGITSTTAELNILDGVTSTTAELNILDGVTSTAAELNLVDGSSAGTIVNSKGVIYGSSGEVNATTLQIAGTSITSTAAEINTLDGVTSTAAELNILDGVTATTDELNILDGVTSTAAEINYVDGVTSNIQTQLDAKQATITNGSVTNAQLAGSIANAKLANSSVSYGGIELALGATDATPAFDLADATNLPIDNIAGITANATNFSNSLLIGQSSTGTLSSADYNVGVGYGVFSSLTSGTGNMANGYNALNSLTTGTGNVAIGRQVLSKITSGSKNVGIGRQAGIQIVGGSVGGTSLVNGNNNTYIGAETVPSASDVSNETVIGYGATGLGSNYAVIGNADVTRVYAAQDAGATLYAGGLNIGGTAVTSTAAELNILDGVTATATELNLIDGVTATTDELNILDGVTSTAAELNILDGVTATAAELNILDGVTATATELNLIDGVTATTAEINYLDGVTSNIQTQIDNAGGASSLNGLSDVLVENLSFFIGSTPSSTNSAAFNVSVGSNALNSVTTGDYNTGVGIESLESVTSATRNTAYGAQSLRYTTGSDNTGLGAYAGDLLTTGSDNVIIGYNADPSANSASNQIVIGKGATG